MEYNWWRSKLIVPTITSARTHWPSSIFRRTCLLQSRRGGVETVCKQKDEWGHILTCRKAFSACRSTSPSEFVSGTGEPQHLRAVRRVKGQHLKWQANQRGREEGKSNWLTGCEEGSWGRLELWPLGRTAPHASLTFSLLFPKVEKSCLQMGRKNCSRV